MSPPLDPLWNRIAAHEIGPQDAALTFTARLARENCWSPEYSARVTLEYRRFCYLACTAGHEVTPSDQVDQAWHLHLTYSRDYWQEFCPQVLERELHHGPTAGGAVEAARYFEQYAQTLRSYEAVFGPPPADIWSPARLRFGVHTRAFRVMPNAVILWKQRRGIVTLLNAAFVLLALGFALGQMLGRAW